MASTPTPLVIDGHSYWLVNGRLRPFVAGGTGEGEPPAPEGEPPVGEPPASEPPASEPPPAATPPDPALGDAGKAALKAERERAAKAERDLKAAQKRLDELETANLNEVDKAIKKAREEATAEAVQALRAEQVADKIALAATGKFADPTDAALMLGDLTRFVTDDGIDTKAIGAAVDQLLADKPHLAASGAPGTPGVPKGARGGALPSIDEQIAAAQAKGDAREVIRLNGQKLAAASQT